MADLTVNVAEGLVVRPDDTLVVVLPCDTTPHDLQAMCKTVADKQIPFEILFIRDADTVAVHRPDVDG